jgi:hypothetical protein
MSLKAFHVIFIVCSIALAIAFGGWAINSFKEQHSYADLFAGIGSFRTAMGLVLYEVMFIKKVKD